MEENKKLSSLGIQVVINKVVTGRVLDIDEKGIFVQTGAEFVQGSLLDLSFTLGEERIDERGILTVVKPPAGVEIEFLKLAPAHLASIKSFLSSYVTLAAKKSGTKRVLLVEDSRQLRHGYGSSLKEAGFAVAEAQSGTEAFVRLQEATFDLVILDLGIEGIDGFKVLNIIRSKPALKDIPVYILSARSNAADVEKAMSLGATEYVLKTDVTPEQLAEKIRNIFA